MQVDAIFFRQNQYFNLNGSGKRLRSSVSPPPLERPLKRTSLDPESNSATPSYAHCSLPEVLDVAMNDEEQIYPPVTEARGRSEDWVTKTSGLRLDSPSLSTLGQLSHTTPPLSQEKEWDHTSNSASYPINTSLSHVPNTTAVPEPFHSDTALQQGIINAQMHIGPSLNEFNENPSSSSLFNAALTTSLPQTPRKPKVKMGRRADCEKCRLGVKGHWMHID